MPTTLASMHKTNDSTRVGDRGFHIPQTNPSRWRHEFSYIFIRYNKGSDCSVIMPAFTTPISWFVLWRTRHYPFVITSTSCTYYPCIRRRYTVSYSVVYFYMILFLMIKKKFCFPNASLQSAGNRQGMCLGVDDFGKFRLQNDTSDRECRGSSRSRPVGFPPFFNRINAAGEFGEHRRPWRADFYVRYYIEIIIYGHTII